MKSKNTGRPDTKSAVIGIPYWFMANLVTGQLTGPGPPSAACRIWSIPIGSGTLPLPGVLAANFRSLPGLRGSIWPLRPKEAAAAKAFASLGQWPGLAQLRLGYPLLPLTFDTTKDLHFKMYPVTISHITRWCPGGILHPAPYISWQPDGGAVLFPIPV